jgi:hypothetical protein
LVVQQWGGSEELGDCEEIDQVCTKCTLLECQFIVEFTEVSGCFRVELSLGFFLYGFYNKKFIKDSELAETESKILP